MSRAMKISRGIEKVEDPKAAKTLSPAMQAMLARITSKGDK
jgi:hypothetical protein